ncbi:acid-sensing ion channel 1A-like isoform X2 [Watersipora subatra]|uniref:acid-sensing ion channel 1A-like isoform X2 n=1 Tax=Watersipora subatra TaxID=2589382 RepID=UPI00355C6F9D
MSWYSGQASSRNLQDPYVRKPWKDEPTNYSRSASVDSLREGSICQRLPRTPLPAERERDGLRQQHPREGNEFRPINNPIAMSTVHTTPNDISLQINSKQPSSNRTTQNQSRVESPRIVSKAYGFNLPTSERLRTRNAQVGKELTEKAAVLTRSYSTGETIAITSGLIIRGFTEKTTTHGIPHIYFATGLIKKLVWAVVTIAALVALCLHLYLLISSWKENAIGTRQVSTQKRKLIFPAVTVCNYNTLRVSTINNYIKLGSLVDEASQQSNGSSDRASLRMDLIGELAKEFTTLEDDEFKDLGHNASELALFCSFYGESCESEYFRYLRDPRYGNCITFNSGRLETSDESASVTKIPLKASSLTGPESGLSFVIFVEQYEYIPVLTPAVGALIVVHNQSVMPFPDQNGISVTAQTLVNIGIRKVSYSQTACLKTCFQRQVAKDCDCYISTVPYDHRSEVFVGLPELSVCDDTIASVASCLARVRDNYEDHTISCDYCHNACYETEFPYSISTASWPAESYLDDLIVDLISNYPDLMKRIRKKARSTEDGQPQLTNSEVNEQVKSIVKSNFLQVNIYYERLQQVTYEEVALYDDYQFASDLGGSFGLWVGWSIITMIEFIEVLIDLLVYFCFGCCGYKKYKSPKKQNRTSGDNIELTQERHDLIQETPVAHHKPHKFLDCHE